MKQAYIVLNGQKYSLSPAEEKAEKPDPGRGDPRYTDIPTGATGGGETTSPGDVRQTVEGIYEMLKTILSRIDENMPYITRACDKDGGN